MRTAIATGRMSLIALNGAELDQLLAGARSVAGVSIPSAWLASDPGEMRMVSFFAGRLREDPSLFEWRFRLMCDLESHAMLGHCGFHDEPHGGMLELGYTVLAAYRRQGYATEAIIALMDEATTEHGVHRFRLAISPTNAPSRALAVKLGFEVVGDQLDPEDGPELLYERQWPPTPQ
ncbi:MAG: GNAT family N-acetyltransferase [Ilumatobacteraceae bacterium]